MPILSISNIFLRQPDDTLALGLCLRTILFVTTTLIFLVVFSLLGQERAFDVVYPKEGSFLQPGASDSLFIFGHADPMSLLYINGQKIDLFKNGSFLAFLPVHRGEFTFDCMAVCGSDTSFIRRSVFVSPLAPQPVPDSVGINPAFVFPQNDLELLPGDVINLSFRGIPGVQAIFSIDSLVNNAPMIEKTAILPGYWGESVFGERQAPKPQLDGGSYNALYTIREDDRGEHLGISYTLIKGDSDSISVKAPGALSILDDSLPRVAQIVLEEASARVGPALSYHYLWPQGTRLHITGRDGRFYRARLAGTVNAWIDSTDIRILSFGTPLPATTVNLVRTRHTERYTKVRVFTEERVPFKIVQNTFPQSLEVIFYGVTANTDWIRYDPTASCIQRISWEQISKEIYKLTILLNGKQQWGYKALYDDQDCFVLDIKNPPHIAGWPHSPLKGISVLIDPGHAPDDGAVGPSGLKEKDANLALAEALELKLLRKGALAYKTRSGEQGIALRARVKMMELIEPDIFLSLHFNALPDGVNPFTNHGTSTYYYHPQSYTLAEIIQQRLVKKLKLPDYGLFYDNLAVCRTTRMPAVLIEPAFLMHPAEEMLIASKKFRDQCAEAIVEALEEFLHKTK
jgi:N-acetylmuramoyl-L-alanine amidase